MFIVCAPVATGFNRLSEPQMKHPNSLHSYMESLKQRGVGFSPTVYMSTRTPSLQSVPVRSVNTAGAARRQLTWKASKEPEEDNYSTRLDSTGLDWTTRANWQQQEQLVCAQNLTARVASIRLEQRVVFLVRFHLASCCQEVNQSIIKTRGGGRGTWTWTWDGDSLR